MDAVRKWFNVQWQVRICSTPDNGTECVFGTRPQRLAKGHIEDPKMKENPQRKRPQDDSLPENKLVPMGAKGPMGT